jgi:nitroimidazol reductase NimA-like FMN-containing flavoprotein (pyridoxamine 5'-phosphate oxidase superfamily)
MTAEWLSGPKPTRRLGRERLEERILNLLAAQNMCVLATAGEQGPLATPVRYFHRDFTLMFTASARSPKIRNIAGDPRVSVGVFAPLVGPASSRGAQLFGRARVLLPGDAEHAERMPTDEVSTSALVVIAAERIVYTEHWLRRDGYAPRQFWQQECSV